MATTTGKPTRLPPGRWLSVATVAERLDMSTKTVRRLIAAGKIDTVRLTPRSIRISEASLAAYIAKNTY